MTCEGRSLDVVTGTLALGLGLWSLRAPLSRTALWAFQLIGFDFPTTLIGPVCVAGALAANLILFRTLAAAHRGERPWPGSP